MQIAFIVKIIDFLEAYKLKCFSFFVLLKWIKFIDAVNIVLCDDAKQIFFLRTETFFLEANVLSNLKYHLFIFDTSFVIKVDPVYWNNKFFIRLQNRLFLVNLSLLNNNLVVVEAEIEIVCEVVREQLVKRNRILQKFWESFNEFFLLPFNFFVRLIFFILIPLLFLLFINNSELVVDYFKQVFLVVTDVNLLIIFLH